MVCSHYYYHRQSQQTTIFPETAQESRGSSLTTSAFLRHSNSPCSRIGLLHTSLALCYHSITGWTSGVDTKACYSRYLSFYSGMSYSDILFVAELTSFESRHDQLSRSFFQDISHSSSSLYHLLPPPRYTSVLSRLKTATRFTRPISRTKNIVPLLITP